VAFGGAANAGVTRHIGNLIQIHGKQQGFHAHTCSRQCRFTTRMAATNHNHVIVHLIFSSYPADILAKWGILSISSGYLAKWVRILLTTLVLSLAVGLLLGFVIVRTNIMLEIFSVVAGILLGMGCAIVWPKDISGRKAFTLFVIFSWVILWIANIVSYVGGISTSISLPILLKALPLTFADFIFGVYTVFAACWAWDTWLRLKGIRQRYRLTDSERHQYDILVLQILIIGIVGFRSDYFRTTQL